MARYVLMLLLSVAGAASAGAPRFSGDASLRPPDAASVDGRFALVAKLKPVAATSANGRFSFAAALRPDPKSIVAICGAGDTVFVNGFEN